MIYLKNNTEKQRIFIPKNGEYQGKKSYKEGYEEGVEAGKAEQKSLLEPITITENGSYSREDGYNEIIVDVPDTNGSYDEGYTEGIEVGKAEQKSLLEPITITENGTYENENGYSTIEVNVEGGDCPELEEITINENGTYEGAYDKVIVDVPQEGGGDINPDTLREITITENGVYTSKYSTPIEKEVTGIFDDGTPFYGYGELNGIIYNTQYTPQQNENGLVFEKVEFWYKGDNITTDAYWNVILSSAPADDGIDTIEFRYYMDVNDYLSLRVDGINDYQLGTLHEGSWYHFLLYMENGNVILKVNDQEVLNVPKQSPTQHNPVPFYINGAYYDANGDGWEGNRNANGCFGMIKIDDQTFIPTENGFINYNTQEPLPVIKAGDYTYNTTDVTFEGEPYKTINVDVQPNLVPLEVTLTANGSYTLGVEDGVDGYNSGTIVVDVPTKVGSITITENGTYYPQDETIKFLNFDGDDVFDLGQGFIQDTDDRTFITIDLKWVGDETGEPMNICGVENSDWDSESCFAIRYYDGNFNAKVGSFEMNFPADNEWHHMELGYQSGVGFIVFDGSLYQEQLGYFTKPTGNIYVGATNTGGEIFRPFRGFIGDIVIVGNSGRIKYYPINNGFRCNNGEEITNNIGGGDCPLEEETIPNSAPIGYNEIHVNVPQEGGDCPVLEEVTITENGSYEGAYNRVIVDVPQEGGSCNLEPLWAYANWEDRDGSDFVNYQPSEGMDGFDSVHINLFDAYLHGKEEAIDSLSEITITENGTYPIKDNILVFDGDDAFNWGRVAENNVIEINFRPIGRGWIFGDENVGLYYDGPYKEIYIYYFQYWDDPESAPWLPVAEGEFSTITIVPERGIIKINDTEFELLLRGDGWTNNQDIIIGGNSEEQRGTFEFRYIKRWNTAEEYEAGVKPIEYINVTQENSLNKNGTPIENIGGGSAEMITLDNGDSVVGYKSVIVNVDTESWYNSGFEDGVENAGSIIAETARVLDITENGTYKSQYSEPTYPDTITGVFPNGENFYSYAQLTNKVFNTGIKLNEISKIEVWYKPKGRTLTNNGGIVGTNNTAFNIITATGAFSGKIGGTTRTYRLPFTNNSEKWYHIELSYDEGFVVDGKNYGTYTQTQSSQETLIWINKYNYSADGYFGMIKIDDTIIIPTANGFLNTNTGRLLEVVKEGDYVFTEELPIYSEGNLIKTINVNVQPNLIPIDKTITKNGTYLFTKQEGMDGYSSGQVVVDVPQNKINIAEAGVKFTHSTFSSVPEWADFSNVTDMSYMFQFCHDLTSIPQLDTSNVTDMSYMFSGCYGLTSIPQLNTSKVAIMTGMFGYCKKLTSIPRLDVSNVNGMISIFQGCPNLTDIGGLINLKVSIDISDTEKLTRESVLNIFNDMAVVDNNQVIKLHENVYLQLTEEDIAIATQKGWSVETEGGGDYEEDNGEA